MTRRQIDVFASKMSKRVCETGFDLNPEVVDGLNHGRSHIDDLGDSEVVEMLGRGFFATTDASELRQEIRPILEAGAYWLT